MRIGIDARHLTYPQEGGFRSYTQSLVSALSRVDKDNEYILYTDRPSDEGAPGDNFRVRAVQGSMPVREQVAMPIALVRDRVDVAHFLCNTAPMLIRCPLVLTVHDVIPCLPGQAPRRDSNRKSRILDRYWKDVIPIAASRAARIITVSESSAEDIRRVLGVADEKITILHNGTDPAFRVLGRDVVDPVLQKYDLTGKTYLLGFLSKDVRKNVDGLIQAYKAVSAKMPDCGLVLVCSSKAVIGMAPEEVLRDTRITVVCAVPRAELIALYNGASALVFPSFAEGFGLPIVEAMACGAPVVASDIPTIREVAGDAATLVNPLDTHGIAEAVYAILSNESYARRLREAGLRRSESFSWDETARRLVEIYAEVSKSPIPGDVELSL